MILERPYNEVEDKFIECRTYNHAWTRSNVAEVDSIHWELRLECARCGTTRADLLLRTGGVKKRKYAYPEGYRMKGRQLRDGFRVELHYRIFTTRTELENF